VRVVRRTVTIRWSNYFLRYKGSSIAPKTPPTKKKSDRPQLPAIGSGTTRFFKVVQKKRKMLTSIGTGQ
jgi:hypothetical protein